MDELDIAAQEIERHKERSIYNTLNAAQRKKIEEQKRLAAMRSLGKKNACKYCNEPLEWQDEDNKTFCDHECEIEYDREQEAMRNGRVRKVDA